jgi:hypothetical protein
MSGTLQDRYYESVLSGDTGLAEALRGEINCLVKSAQRKTGITPDKINTVLNDDNMPAIYIYRFLNEKYKDAWWDWDIMTIEHCLWMDFGVVLSDVNADKVQAIKLLINNQRPFLDWYYFNQVACSFAGSIADFTCIKSPSPGMAIAAMKTMMEIRPDEQFSRDVKKYVCLICIHDGIYTVPPSLRAVLSEEFEQLIQTDTKAMWSDTMKKAAEMMGKDYGYEDDPASVQARRILIAEHASNVFGG